jgi:hypothetical protein
LGIASATTSDVNCGSDFGATLPAPVPTSEKCIDNTQKVAVYIASMTTHMHSESTGEETTVAVTYDPLTTAMLFEYNPDYLSDSNIAANLTTENYSILIVPMSQMSDTAAVQINSYIESGGSVWFLNDPVLTPAGNITANRIPILGTSVSDSVNNSTTITVVKDNITSGLNTSFKPVGNSSKTTYMRSLNGSGTISGLNYQVLMSTSTNALLIKYENPANGARVIYSNPNMFISGGSASYFNARTATQLFLQTKAWVMKLAQNPDGVEITYPKSDKQFIITIDDVEAAEWETHTMDMMFNVEKKAGVTPEAVNTFFIIPSIANTITSELRYYAQNGDIHTLHPHVDINTYLNYSWDKTGISVATYQAAINTDKALINKLMNTSDYGITAWRFPYTTFCTNSMQAVSNSGFTIDSSSGIGSHGIQIGDPIDNTVLFPKQLLVKNAKSNLIEMEIAAPFDIDCVIPGTVTMSPTVFYDKYNNSTTQFKNGNFPMNFVVICHIQGAGTDAGMASGLGKIIKSEQTANPNYANFNTLANYLIGIKSAKITASISGNRTIVNIVNTKPITDFTMKVAIGKVTSAKCDDTSIPSSQIKQDTLTSSWYITQTIDAGKHVFEITTA